MGEWNKAWFKISIHISMEKGTWNKNKIMLRNTIESSLFLQKHTHIYIIYETSKICKKRFYFYRLRTVWNINKSPRMKKGQKKVLIKVKQRFSTKKNNLKNFSARKWRFKKIRHAKKSCLTMCTYVFPFFILAYSINCFIFICYSYELSEKIQIGFLIIDRP